jgi:hypothetical protein
MPDSGVGGRGVDCFAAYLSPEWLLGVAFHHQRVDWFGPFFKITRKDHHYVSVAYSIDHAIDIRAYTTGVNYGTCGEFN